MSDEGSSGEKTEEPTGKRRKQFRDEGRVPLSKDVSAVVLAVVAFALVAAFGPALADGAMTQMSGAMARIAEVPARGRDTMFLALGDAALAIGRVGVVGAVVLAAVGAAVGIAQTGGLWASKNLGFKLERLNLLSGLQRVFLSLDTLVQLGMTLAKAVAIGSILYVVLDDELERLPSLVQVSVTDAFLHLGALLTRITIAALLVTAVLAAADWLLTSRKLHEQMKMTKQEVKDELKQQEGDPLIRQRMRARMRQIGRNRMLAAVRKADVVIVNPTHYAVALAYRPGDAGAPRLVAKGVDHMAAKIREVARAHQVPIIPNPPVARAIQASARVGHEIPGELFEAVARVLAYVYRMTRWRNG